MIKPFIYSTFILAAVFLNVPCAVGEDFRVENLVFSGNDKEPAGRSTTIFHNGMVFDYLEDPAEVIVLEPSAGRFVLLDLSRRIRAELSTKHLAAFTQRLRQSADAHNDPFLRFMAAPKFDEHLDRQSGELTLSSEWMTYRLLTVEAGSRAIADQYREFSDWYARLNTMLHPGSKPPFARLLVNDALARREATPREVHLTFMPKKTFPPKRITIRSEHKLSRHVPKADLDRMAQTREFMRIFQPVGFGQYRKRP